MCAAHMHSLLQPGESSLQETQAMVQEQAGVLLDRQRIAIEGTHLQTHNQQLAISDPVCPDLNTLHVNLPCHLCDRQCELGIRLAETEQPFLAAFCNNVSCAFLCQIVVLFNPRGQVCNIL